MKTEADRVSQIEFMWMMQPCWAKIHRTLISSFDWITYNHQWKTQYFKIHCNYYRLLFLCIYMVEYLKHIIFLKYFQRKNTMRKNILDISGLRLTNGLPLLRVWESLSDCHLSEGATTGEGRRGWVKGHGDPTLLVPLLLALQAGSKGTAHSMAQPLALLSWRKTSHTLGDNKRLQQRLVIIFIKNNPE